MGLPPALARARLDRMRRLRSTRTRAAVAVTLLAVLLVAALAAAFQGFLLAPGAQVPTTVDTPDADADGVPDAVENYIGTDPLARRPVARLPEEWITRHRLDVADPELPNRTAAYPRPPESPPIYGPLGLPPEYRMTYLDVYSYRRPASWDEATNGLWESGLDPNEWDVNGTGVPYAWTIHHGLDPFDPTILDVRDPRALVPWTPREAYIRGLHPFLPDGDGDGLQDVDEERLQTSPRRFSTAGTGIADGWLVRHNFDPLDAAIAYEDTDRDGLSNLDEFLASYRTHPNQTLAGGGLNPRKMSTGDSPVPDGWLVRHRLDPLENDVHLRVTEEKTLKGRDGRTALRQLRVVDEYLVGRPPLWDESRNGPWYGGSDPRSDDSDKDGISDLEEMTGWEIRKSAGLKWVVSDPTRADSDRDGLKDGEERDGRVGDLTFSPTDPSAPDSDVDGLLDGEELGIVPWRGITLPPLNPTSDDTDQDGLVDGSEAEYWLARSLEAGSNAVYRWGPPDRPTTAKALARENLPEGALVEALLPSGDIDRDNVPNILDADADGDGLLDGWEIKPELYLSSPHAAAQSRPATDPANEDTDLDSLPDRWEIRFGVFDEKLGGWNLDPSQWSSLRDGKSDGVADLDGDSIQWYAYVDGAQGRREVVNTFVATNRIEYESGSDPNKRATSADGISDGWKIFWGKTYLALQDTELGLVYPGAPGALRLPPERPIPRIGNDDDFALGSAAVSRVVTIDGVRVRGEDCPRIFEVRNPAGGMVRLCLFREEMPFGYRAASRNFTNPYLDDTDGDGIPDAWEAAWGLAATGANRVSPVALDAGEDFDSDGLDNLAEWRADGSPYLADSDLGGAGDLVESRLGLDLFDPTDDARALDTSTDTDGDKLPDVTEVIGVLNDKGQRLRTDPRDVDTDKDGLLDGPSLSDVLGRLLRKDVPADAALLASLEARGLIVVDSPDGTSDIMGEASYGADPTRLSTSGEGIPDGWAARFWRGPTEPTNLLREYSYGRPAWWNESMHGVWRWGLLPGQVATRDHDLDGLDDFNGEDPIPFANARNVLSRGDPRDPAINATERLLRAQAYGAPPLPGEPLPRFHGNLTLYPIDENVTANGTARFAGNLTTYEEVPQPIANATVILSLGTRDVILGVAITNETGEFNETFTLDSIVRAHPNATGLPLFGATDASGTHQNPDRLLRALDLTKRQPVFAWTYNESFHPAPRQVRNMKVNDSDVGSLYTSNSTSHLVNFTVGTRISFEVPATAAIGTRQTVAAVLTDALGRPVPGATVRVEPPGVDATTDANGKASVELELPNVPGPLPVNASFPGRNRLLPSNATGSVRVTETTALTLSPPPLAVRPNTSFTLSGRLVTFRGAPVENATVTLEGPSLQLSATTGRLGTFTLEVALPPEAPLGDLLLRGAYAGNDTLVGTGANVTLVTVGSPRWEASSVRGAVGGSVPIEGRLLHYRGGALANREVSLRLPDGTVLTNRTDAEGRVGFRLDLSLARPGEALVNFEFRDPFEGEASLAVTVSATTTSALTLAPLQLVRGEDAVFVGRLVDGTGRPLPRQSVAVHFEGTSQRVLTTATGEYAATFPTTALQPGRVQARASFAGSTDGIYGPSAADAEDLLPDAPFLRLSSATILASRPVLDGRLTTLLNEPLPGRELRARVGQSEAPAVTDGEGRFQILLSALAEHPLGPVVVNWSLEGDDLLLSLENGTTLFLKDLGTLDADLPLAMLQGGTARVPYKVLDSRERHVPDARLVVTLDGRELTVSHAGGVASFTLPRDVRPGKHRLDVDVDSSLVAVGNVTLELDVQREARLSLVSAPSLVPGATGMAVVKLQVGQQALPGEALFVRGGPVEMQVLTDAEGIARVPITLSKGERVVHEIVYLGRGENGPAALAVQVPSASAPLAESLGFRALPWLLLALLVVVGIVAFVMLRRRRDPAAVVRRTARKLRSSRADVGALYEAYLSLLSLAGLDEDAAETVTFGALLKTFLDEGELEADTGLLTEVFNRAVYAPALLDEGSVHAASDALERIAARMHAPRAEAPVQAVA